MKYSVWRQKLWHLPCEIVRIWDIGVVWKLFSGSKQCCARSSKHRCLWRECVPPLKTSWHIPQLSPQRYVFSFNFGRQCLFIQWSTALTRVPWPHWKGQLNDGANDPLKEFLFCAKKRLSVVPIVRQSFLKLTLAGREGYFFSMRFWSCCEQVGVQDISIVCSEAGARAVDASSEPDAHGPGVAHDAAAGREGLAWDPAGAQPPARWETPRAICFSQISTAFAEDSSPNNNTLMFFCSSSKSPVDLRLRDRNRMAFYPIEPEYVSENPRRFEALWTRTETWTGSVVSAWRALIWLWAAILQQSVLTMWTLISCRCPPAQQVRYTPKGQKSAAREKERLLWCPRRPHQNWSSAGDATKATDRRTGAYLSHQWGESKAGQICVSGCVSQPSPSYRVVLDCTFPLTQIYLKEIWKQTLVCLLKS